MDDKRYKELEKENEALTEEFRRYLEEKYLTYKTISNHVDNVDFYTNTYLLDHYDGVDAVKGIDYSYIGDFFGYFFIRKCMWSTPYTIKTTAASIKKFYKFMCETGRVTKEEYEDFAYYLKESIEDWCEDCQIFNDGGEYINI